MNTPPATRGTPFLALLCAFFCLTTGCAGSACRDAWFGSDKAAHFAAAFVIGAGSAAVARGSGQAAQPAAGAGLGVAAAAGAAKEAHDLEIRRTCWSWRDFVWDLIGGTAGALIGASSGR